MDEYSKIDISFNDSEEDNCPIMKPLSNFTLFISIYDSSGDDVSDGFSDLAASLGAQVQDKINKKTKYIVFKNGPKKILTQSLKRKIPILSPLWLEECRITQKHITVDNFIANINVNTYNQQIEFKINTPKRRKSLDHSLIKSPNPKRRSISTVDRVVYRFGASNLSIFYDDILVSLCTARDDFVVPIEDRLCDTCHYLIAGDKRTEKVLNCLAKGTTILSPDYLMKALESQDLPDASLFIHHKFKSNGLQIFRNKKFYIANHIIPSVSFLSKLITYKGGTISSPRDCDFIIGRYDDSEDDNIPRVDYSWIFDSLEKGILIEYNEYLISTDESNSLLFNIKSGNNSFELDDDLLL